MRNTLLAGVIQTFEFVYEISVKMVKRRVELDALVPGEIDGLGFRDLLRVAAESGLVGDASAWFQYRQMRDITAHTYDHEKAEQVRQGLSGFLIDADALLVRPEALNG